MAQAFYFCHNDIIKLFISEFDKEITNAKQRGNRQNEEITFGHSGVAYYDLREYDKALANYELAIVIAQQINDKKMKKDGMSL